LLAAFGLDNTLHAHFVYGAFGENLAAWERQGGDWRRRFNGKEGDQISGLNYYGYRYYDPLTLRWTSADPLYRFIRDRPSRDRGCSFRSDRLGQNSRPSSARSWSTTICRPCGSSAGSVMKELTRSKRPSTWTKRRCTALSKSPRNGRKRLGAARNTPR